MWGGLTDRVWHLTHIKYYRLIQVPRWWKTRRSSGWLAMLSVKKEERENRGGAGQKGSGYQRGKSY